MTLVQSLLSHIRSHPEQLAFLDKRGPIPFARFGVMVSDLARHLRETGVERGDRVLLCAPNGVSWAASYFAVHAMGCVAVPLDFAAVENTIQRVVAETSPKLALSGRTLPVTLPTLELSEECEASESAAAVEAICESDDVADILFTTGTTGQGKGVVLTHRQIAAAATNINEFIGSRLGDVEVVTVPLSHSFGLGRLRCMAQSGTTLVLEPGLRNAAMVLKRLLDCHATGLAMVPAGFEILLQMTKDRLGDAKEHLRYIEIGSAPMRLETKQKLMSLLPKTRICHHYGLTEASRAAFIEYHADREHLTSIGHASPNVEIAFHDENGREVAPGEVGELVVRGGMVMKEYLGKPELTAKTLEGGWLHTGDLGRKDADGYFYLLSRRDDVINVGGLKVHPEEVENALNAHPAIVEAACVGADEPHQKATICVKAFLVVREEVPDVDLVAWLRPQLEEYKIPRLWERVDSLPKTSSGKLQRKRLVL
jgi:long-chain acyl-CoA synthetase